MSDLTDMVIDKKATLTYVQLMKEDLAVFRLVPEDGVIPDYDACLLYTSDAADE